MANCLGFCLKISLFCPYSNLLLNDTFCFLFIFQYFLFLVSEVLPVSKDLLAVTHCALFLSLSLSVCVCVCV